MTIRQQAAFLFCVLGALVFPGPAACETAAEPAPGAEETEQQLVGYELGHFRIKNFLPVEGTTTTLTFTLHAAVEEGRAERFHELVGKRMNRIRQQVIIASRLGEQSDFEDPELRRLRRRIQVRFYRALPELKIEDLYFSEFRYESK